MQITVEKHVKNFVYSHLEYNKAIKRNEQKEST